MPGHMGLITDLGADRPSPADSRRRNPVQAPIKPNPATCAITSRTTSQTLTGARMTPSALAVTGSLTGTPSVGCPSQSTSSKDSSPRRQHIHCLSAKP